MGWHPRHPLLETKNRASASSRHTGYQVQAAFLCFPYPFCTPPARTVVMGWVMCVLVGAGSAVIMVDMVSMGVLVHVLPALKAGKQAEEPREW